MSDWVVEARDLTKIYIMGEVEVHALRGLSLQIRTGEVIAIMGPSGSGKSTLMNMLGCLDRPSSGRYYLDGENVAEMNDDQLADIRNRKVGFVFQSFNLLPRSTALANVELPLRYSPKNGANRRQKAKEALEAVGLADEPTGNLNSKSGDEIMELLLKLNKERSATLIIVTHDPEVAELTQRVIYIRDGHVEVEK